VGRLGESLCAFFWASAKSDADTFITIGSRRTFLHMVRHFLGAVRHSFTCLTRSAIFHLRALFVLESSSSEESLDFDFWFDLVVLPYAFSNKPLSPGNFGKGEKFTFGTLLELGPFGQSPGGSFGGREPLSQARH
jgi:hypothetical protein